MSRSLKSLLPDLARILGATEFALYERQRALVREGLLELRPGHGRGSGVQATAEAVAILVIGMLASSSLTEVAACTRELAKARVSGGKCRLTGATTFQDALAALLADVTLASRVREVLVGQTIGQAYIRYADPPKSSVFVGTPAKRAAIQFTASLPAETLIALAKEMPR
jgi:hypothetical protein